VTQGERSGADWWADVPTDRVVRLDGVAPALLHLSLDPLPDAAPSVLRYRPAGSGTPAEQVAALLDELERAAVDLFPCWLPGADAIVGPQGAGVAAIRTLAFEAAATSPHFGPFLADLAERALRHRTRPRTGPVPLHVPVPVPVPVPGRESALGPAVRAAGLARVIAAGYRRPAAALLIEVPEGLTAIDERALAACAEWLVEHSGWAVWLTGARLRAVDRIDDHPVRLSDELESLAREATAGLEPEPEPVEPGASPWNTAQSDHAVVRDPVVPGPVVPGPVLRSPAVAGAPRADSPAELKLESALRGRSWAAGRLWNQTYQPDQLAETYRLDLWWAAEHCVVEVDGPEHRSAVHYASDRRRDVRLQLDGHAVLRFTNAQVLADVHTVVSQIERLVRSRRP
jgi:very-short-patch-repair endonuclease